jgi:chemotaxis protein MotB
MQQSGIAADQITQVRGFADQRLGKPDAPLDPGNRRISLIVQYLQKAPSADSAEPAESAEGGEKSRKRETRNRGQRSRAPRGSQAGTEKRLT